MKLLTCRNLCLGYEHVSVLSDLNFSLDAGSYLCIVGENGSGKTTLMRTILGLQSPLSGEIIWENGTRRMEIGYLPQQTSIQRDFPATVWEIVLSGCQGRAGLRPFYNREEKELARASMDRTGVTVLKDRCYRTLSGGQQQRVLLARALCAARSVFLLDEPVSGLDPNATREMYQLIEKLNQDGMTILMISHDIGAALRYATHILHAGSKVFFGTVDDYIASREKEGILPPLTRAEIRKEA